MAVLSLATYDDLIASINSQGGFMHRNDLADVLPVAVQMCETTINYGDGDQLDGLRVAAQETVTTLTCTPGTQTVALPTDWLEIRRIYITVSGIRRELKGRPVAPISVTDAAVVQSIPETFFIQGRNLYLDPIPNSAFPITLDYYAAVGPLATQGTNWLLTAAPIVYLAGTILHMAPWMGPTFNADPWAKGFAVGMKQVQSQDSSRYANIRLRSEVASMVGNGAGYGWGNFLAGT